MASIPPAASTSGGTRPTGRSRGSWDSSTATRTKCSQARLSRIRRRIPMAQDDGRDEGAARDAFERELTTDLKDTTPDSPRGWPLHTRILVGLGVGVVGGLLVNWVWGGDHPAVAWAVRHVTEPIGTLFLRALLMIVIPLIASSLIVGVAGIGDVRKLGRVGLRSFAYCFAISAISVLIGLTLANTIRPG